MTPAEHLAACARVCRTEGIARAVVRADDVELEIVLGPLPGAAPTVAGDAPVPDPLETLAGEWDRRARGEK